MDRLFVNLKKEPYEDFLSGKKKYEMRAYKRGGFSEPHVYCGRRVELRFAWNRGSAWGTIGRVLVGSIEEIFDSIDFSEVKPRAKSREDAVSEIREMLKSPQKYITFEVNLDFAK